MAIRESCNGTGWWVGYEPSRCGETRHSDHILREANIAEDSRWSPSRRALLTNDGVDYRSLPKGWKPRR